MINDRPHIYYVKVIKKKDYWEEDYWIVESGGFPLKDVKGQVQFFKDRHSAMKKYVEVCKKFAAFTNKIGFIVEVVDDGESDFIAIGDVPERTIEKYNATRVDIDAPQWE